MTMPSDVLEAIGRAMAEAFTVPDDAGIDRPFVRVLSADSVDGDVSDTATVPAPAVVLTCTGMTDASNGPGELLVDGEFVARCYARLPKGPADPKRTRGDVAMDLAAAVAKVVEGNLFRLPDGTPATVRHADQVRISNGTTRGTLEAGHALWTVRWRQRFEVRPQDSEQVLYRLRSVAATFDLPGGEVDTHDESALIEVTHG